jgi:hypothetical protein
VLDPFLRLRLAAQAQERLPFEIEKGLLGNGLRPPQAAAAEDTGQLVGDVPVVAGDLLRFLGQGNEFGVPNGIPAHLQKLWTKVHSVCAAATGLPQICANARDYWHPDNPVGVP